LTDIVKRLRAYITANDDEWAPINEYADYMLIEEAAVAIETMRLALETALEILESPDGVEQPADQVGSDDRNHGKDQADSDVGC
jgi:hypothetical protein